MLCLPPIPADHDYQHVVVAGVCFVQKEVIAAGRAFWERFEQRPVTEPQTPSSAEAVDSEPELMRTESKRNKKKETFSGNALRLSNLVKEKNLYQILGVGESATGDELKKTYRKLVLERHPDKLSSDSSPRTAEKGRTMFLQIQEAFEVLSDDRSRRMYDSSLPFDDTIPSEKSVKKDEDFYLHFGDALRRNERWSIVRPVPGIGGHDATREEVESMYSFWWNTFESWRDFSHHDEHDLKHSESRDEKRWMEVQNARIRKKRLAEESARVRRLVDLAYKVDPRVRAFKQADIDEIAAAKAAKLAEKQAKEDAKHADKRAIEAAILEAEEAAKLMAERTKSENKEIKKMRGEIRQVLGIHTSDICAYKIEQFNSALIERLVSAAAAAKLLARAKECVDTVEAFMDEVITGNIVLAATPLAAPAASPKAVAPIASPKIAPSHDVASHDWTADELQLLTRGMQKFPIGTVRRWEVIQSLIGGNRSVSEIIEMSKLVAMKKVIEPQLLVTHKTKAVVADQMTSPDIDYDKLAEEWSVEQQAQLEEGIRKFPATMPAAERWTLIAEEVNGKTKAECVARFKYIRELIAKKK